MSKANALNPRELALVALDAAQSASPIVMQGYRSRPAVRNKGGSQLVTEFDLLSEEHIRERLREATPALPIVGEEQGGEDSGALTWYIDPIDGTNNFIHGHPVFAISIGLMQGARPVAGAVVAPALGLEWHGWGPAGGVVGAAYRNGVACRVSETAELKDAIITTGFPSGKDSRLRSLDAVAKSCRDVRRSGSAAIELCWVADGTYEAYWMKPLRYWDTAAAAAILLGAGGHWVTAEHGGERSELGTNGRVDAELNRVLCA